jgi:hypothetical protein
MNLNVVMEGRFTGRPPPKTLEHQLLFKLDLHRPDKALNLLALCHH